jgi:hypothetical protein
MEEGRELLVIVARKKRGVACRPWPSHRRSDGGTIPSTITKASSNSLGEIAGGG